MYGQRIIGKGWKIYDFGGEREKLDCKLFYGRLVKQKFLMRKREEEVRSYVLQINVFEKISNWWRIIRYRDGIVKLVLLIEEKFIWISKRFYYFESFFLVIWQY